MLPTPLPSGPSSSAEKESDYIAEDPGFESRLVPKIFLLLIYNTTENVSKSSETFNNKLKLIINDVAIPGLT